MRILTFLSPNQGIRRRRVASRVLGCLCLMLVLGGAPANARDQWQIQRQTPPPTSAEDISRFGADFLKNQQQMAPEAVPGLPAPGRPSLKSALTPEFVRNILRGYIMPGTMLSGVLESDLSSEKNKRGDVFAVTLEDGYRKEGEEIIPPGSRIIGTVLDAFPAKKQRNGMPGRLSVALQTLAFPDGRTSKFSGFIEHNPAHDQENEPKVRMAGFGLSQYGQAVKGMIGSFGSGIGFIHARRMRGKPFSLKQGTAVAIKVNRRVDLTKMSAPVGAIPGLSESPAGGSTPAAGLPMTNQQPAVPGLVNPQPEPLPANSAGAFTGIGVPQKMPSPAVPGLTGVTSVGDPNSIFSVPLNQAAGSRPNPF